MHRILLVFGLSLCFGTAFSQIKLVLKGEVKGDTKGFDKVYFYNQSEKDSATVVNGRFEHVLEADDAKLMFCYTQYQAQQGMFAPMPLFFDRSGVLHMTWDLGVQADVLKMEGAKAPVKVFKFQQETKSIYMSVNKSLVDKYGQEALRPAHPQHEEVKEKRAVMVQQRTDSLLNASLSGEEPGAEAYILMTQASSLPLDKLEGYYTRLGVAQATEYGKTVEAKISGLKHGNIGQEVPDFVLKNELGEAVSLKDMRGKYVLVDFWASWCGPCRQSFPRIRSVYTQLAGKPFEILNISTDQNYKAWLKAVGEEKNPWPQAYDDQKIGYRYFNVTALPTTFLIDPSGVIIMKEVGFDPDGGGKLEQKLEELFDIKFK